jgi:hypothetical protein
VRTSKVCYKQYFGLVIVTPESQLAHITTIVQRAVPRQQLLSSLGHQQRPFHMTYRPRRLPHGSSTTPSPHSNLHLLQFHMPTLTAVAQTACVASMSTLRGNGPISGDMCAIARLHHAHLPYLYSKQTDAFGYRTRHTSYLPQLRHNFSRIFSTPTH